MLPRLARLRVEGPLNVASQATIIKAINKLERWHHGPLAVVVNSFGGSLRSTNNIVNRIKKYRDTHQVPIYCFAQDFCFNSANLILTLGTKCYASKPTSIKDKFSMIGDFGYVFEGIDDSQFQQYFRVGKDYFSTIETKVRSGPFDTVQLNDKKAVEDWLQQSQQELEEEIINNRKINIQLNNGSIQQFKDRVFTHRVIDPQKAVEYGLIDKVYNIEDLTKEHFRFWRIKEANKKLFESPLMNFFFELAMGIRRRRKEQ